jgi:cytoskeletal protein CcmA (bactofilin family)
VYEPSQAVDASVPGKKLHKIRGMKMRKPDFGSTRVSLIAENLDVEGRLVFSGELIVNGVVRGDLVGKDARSKIQIGPSGQVVGDIKVPTVLISGRVDGEVYASEHVSLQATARVTGNIYYAAMDMVKGCQFTGSIRQLESAMVIEQADVRMAQRAATVTSLKPKP